MYVERERGRKRGKERKRERERERERERNAVGKKPVWSGRQTIKKFQ